MAYSTPRTWVAGEYPTAAQFNANIRDNQNAAFPLGVDAWTTFTPTLTQSGAVTKTVTYAKYQRVGRLIVVNVLLTCTGSGSAANQVIVGLPVTAALNSTIAPIGTMMVADQSAGLNYTGALALASTTTVYGLVHAAGNVLGVSGFAAALASGDTVGYQAVYEAAS